MRTVIVSDLHLGVVTGADLLRRERFRAPLLAELAGADQVVLLGDVIELRDRPLAEALELARPFFAELGAALGPRPVVLVPGNHDHNLLDPWLETRRLRSAGPIGLEHLGRPRSGALARLADWARPAELSFAYPGLWLREDVYATHGHYLDVHLTLPTFERLGIGAIERLSGGLPDDRLSPADYEAIEAPLYALLYRLAQARREATDGSGASPSMRAWEALSGRRGGRAASLRGRLLGLTVLPGAIGIANRLGIGPVKADLSPAEIDGAGVRAMAETARRLGIEAEHVIFGHTHRRGPLAGRDEGPGHAAWAPATGARLHNTGSWVYAPSILGPTAARSVFWPGTVIVVDDDGPPRAHHLLDDLNRDELGEVLEETPASQGTSSRRGGGTPG